MDSYGINQKTKKKELVIKLYEEGKTTREIAKIVKISLRDIGIFLREYNKEPEPKPQVRSCYSFSIVFQRKDTYASFYCRGFII